MAIKGFGTGNGGASPIQTKINLNQQPQLVCAKCGGEIFVQTAVVFDVNAILSPTGKRQSVAAPYKFACASCGAIETYIHKEDFSSEEGIINTPIDFS